MTSRPPSPNCGAKGSKSHERCPIRAGGCWLRSACPTAENWRSTNPGTLRPFGDTSACPLPSLLVAQGDVVRLGDLIGLDRPQPLARALAGLPEQLEGIGGRARRGSALRIGPVFLDEVGLQGRGDFVGRLERVVDGQVPCCVVNHAVSIASQRSRNLTGQPAPPTRTAGPGGPASDTRRSTAR